MARPRNEPFVFDLLRACVANRRRVAWLIVGSLLLVLYSARDPLALRLVRNQLKKVPGAEVTVHSLHLHALLNGVTIGGLQVFRPADKGRAGPAGRQLRLAEVTELEVRWPWLGLLRGGLSCEAYVRGLEASLWRIAHVPVLKAGEKPPKKIEKELTPEPPPPENVVAAWPQIARFVLPMAIDRVEVQDGRFWLRDCTTDPEVKFAIDGIELTARNLTNRERLSDGRYATVDVGAQPAGGKCSLHMELDPLAKSPTFGLRTSVQDVMLTKVNQVLQAYAKVDVESGTFNARVEVLSEKGRFHGFVEPRIVGLKVRPRAEKEAQDSVLNRLWRTAVRAATSLVANSKEETIATRLPLKGEFVSPELGVWDAVTTLLGNAYLRALQPSVTAVDALPLLKPKAPANADEARAPKPTSAAKVKPAGKPAPKGAGATGKAPPSKPHRR